MADANNDAPGPKYAHAIPSLFETIPTLPVLGDLDVNRRIQANTLLDPANLTNARLVAKKMKSAFDSPVNPGVTNDMVESSKLRLRAIEGAHAAAQYAPDLMEGIANMMQRLGAIDDRLRDVVDRLQDRLGIIEGRLGAIEDNTQVNNALTLNHRIIARNQINQPRCEPLRKTVHGHNLNHLVSITRAIDRRNLAEPPQPVPIGNVPANFNLNIASYTSKDIAKLILFYNEDFGIVENDDEAVRRSKLIMFLSRY